MDGERNSFPKNKSCNHSFRKCWIEKDQTRIAELEGLFAAANETDDEEVDTENLDTENGVLPKALVKALKDEKKLLAGEVKEARKQMKERRKNSSKGLFSDDSEAAAEAADDEAEGLAKWERIQAIDLQLERHSALDAELKKLKANIRETEKTKDELVAAARGKISEDDAEVLILERFQHMLTEQFEGYLRQDQRAFIAAVENLWQKYAVTTKQILAERDREALQLNIFLKELGYE